MSRISLAAFLILSTAATVALNHWNRWFFDSLEARDVGGLTQAVLVFAVIIAFMAAIGVGIVLTRETLQIDWRAWIVKPLVDRWLSRQRFYHLNVTGKEPPNPEYRISDDTRWATEPLVDLGRRLDALLMLLLRPAEVRSEQLQRFIHLCELLLQSAELA